MSKAKIVSLVILVAFLVCGCKSWGEITGTADKDSNSAASMMGLSAKEKHYLESWDKAAKMAEEAEDSQTAIIFYAKIIDYFPDTDQAENAENRITELKKSGISDDADLVPLHELGSREQHFLSLWQKSAKMAEDIDDYAMAILFYERLQEYFPDTAEGVNALERLSELNALDAESE